MAKELHSAIQELNSVHDRMKKKFSQKTKVSADKKRAEKMQMYLQKFKKFGNVELVEENKKSNEAQRELNTQGIEKLANDVGLMLNIGKTGGYSLFRNQHSWYVGKNARLGADDIFEAELYALLTKAGEEALVDNDIDLGVELVGGHGANIADAKEVASVADKIAADMIKKLPAEKVQELFHENEIITAPTVRSGKVDVTGYSRDINIEADIKPEWQDFFRTFQGASFSLKNYSSNSQYNTIHLGNTNSLKAMYGVLTSLGYQQKKATHIYVHSRISYLFGHTAKNEPGPSHILHMRFAYELTGSGLYTETEQGLKPMDEVDFFIYNDPASDNIYVKSSKEMVTNAIEYTDFSKIGDPWNSSIVVLKSSFE